MIANYHTHTYRCGHAEGREDEYAAEAARAGLQILGFSDHTPQDYFDAGPEPPHKNVRMLPAELPGYADSIRRLAEEYRGRMEIRLGVEAEYYPKYFPRLLAMLRDSGVEYMILGQHYLGNEIGDVYSGRYTEDATALSRYVSQCTEALETELFTYFAHPDLLHFGGSDAVYEREMRRLCRAARRTQTPLEINLLGIREERHYPDERFWKIAGEEGCTAVIGCDAHEPKVVKDSVSEAAALGMVSRFGLKLLDTVEIRHL